MGLRLGNQETESKREIPPFRDQRVKEIAGRLVEVVRVVTSQIEEAAEFSSPGFLAALQRDLARHQEKVPALFQTCVQELNKPLDNYGVTNLKAIIETIHVDLGIGARHEIWGLQTWLEVQVSAVKRLYAQQKVDNFRKQFPATVKVCKMIVNKPLRHG